MSSRNKLPLASPWAEFLTQLDTLLPQQTKLHCIGGFVVSLHYGAPRTTGDIDYFSVLPISCVNELQAIAGQDSALANRYKVQLQHVAVNNLPENYESRLVEMFPRHFRRLRLYAPDPYDLILSKLERNSGKDRDDAAYLAHACHLNPEVLRARYEKELRPYLANESRHDLSLKLWLESCFPPHSGT